jgi:hypothetical protein
MISVLASSAVDREFEPRSGQAKDYEIGIYCFSTILKFHDKHRQTFFVKTTYNLAKMEVLI